MKNIKIAMFVLGIGFLLMVSGISLALYRYNIDGTNKELITGDIWMKYTGSNQLVINDMLPSAGIKVLKVKEEYNYIYNENMTTEEISACIEYFSDYNFDEGETVEAYCQGTGTRYGSNIRNIPRYGILNYPGLQELKVFVKDIIYPAERFIYTSLVYNEEVTEEEINLCMQYSGSDNEEYCRGTGTIDGKTLSERLKDIEDLDYYEIVEEYSPFIASNVIKPVVDMPYFEFTIEGKNTYTKKDIIYEIVLNHGADHETRTTRIKDENLQFTLIEVDEDGNYVDIYLSKQKYFDLTNKRIWVDRVPANSNSEVNKIYRLYMNIANDTIIGNVNQDYTMDEWSDIYASIKVGVSGDFLEKELEPTDERCFEGYEETIYKYNENITEDGVSACVQKFGSYYWPDETETPEAFCQGTGTWQGTTIQEYFEGYVGYSDEFLVENGVLVFDKYGDFIIEDYDETCGGNLIFPETINDRNYQVWAPFYNKEIIRVTFSSTMTFVEHEQFIDTPLLDIFIPSNITHVYCMSFDSDVNVVYENEGYVCDPNGGNG